MKIIPIISTQYNQNQTKNNTSFGMKFLPEVIETLNENKSFLSWEIFGALEKLNRNQDKFLLGQFSRAFRNGNLGFNMVVYKEGGEVFNAFVPIKKMTTKIKYLMSDSFLKKSEKKVKQDAISLEKLQKALLEKPKTEEQKFEKEEYTVFAKKSIINQMNQRV